MHRVEGGGGLLRSHDGARVIRVPPAADIPLSELADSLRAQGFVVEAVNAKVLRAHAPPSADAGVLDVAHWSRGPTLLIERGDSGLTMTPRPPVMQLALTSLLFSVFTAGVFTDGLLWGIIVGSLIGVGSFASLYASFRRRGTTLLLQFLPAGDKGVDESPPVVQSP